MDFGSRIESFVNRFIHSRNIIFKLIIINVIIFVLIGFLRLGFLLFTGIDSINEIYSTGFLKVWNNLSLSADINVFIRKPWTLVTYMFMHSGFWHIFWNMIILYWFGSIFREFQGDQKVLSTFILGGIAGGLLYLIAYQALPFLHNKIPFLGMVGASASVLAVLVAAATLTPNYSVNLLFIGPVKLKYIALVLVLIDIISFPEGNYGGHIAHLGGALYGFVYVIQLKQGRDIGGWLNKFLHGIGETFKRKPKPGGNFKTYRGGQYYQQKENGSRPGKKKQSKEPKKQGFDESEIDGILDKIAQSGYESLSEREKDILFNASKR